MRPESSIKSQPTYLTVAQLADRLQVRERFILDPSHFFKEQEG
ncbi:MAG TPA: hypothetical protein VK557_01660 [Pyrinomonadaceae bacterium]|nr:hypothetical protein [Pyrinomonadaceae bacterium]